MPLRFGLGGGRALYFEGDCRAARPHAGAGSPDRSASPDQASRRGPEAPRGQLRVDWPVHRPGFRRPCYTGRVALADAGRSRTPSVPPFVLKVGTVVWLASELMFFSGLFAAYYFLRAITDVWPPAGVELEVGRAFALVFVSSSSTYHVAASAAHRGDHGRAIRWTLVTTGVGVVFLVNQAAEYATAGYTISSHPYGSMFYMMTGFHALHVTKVGLKGRLLRPSTHGTGTPPPRRRR